MAESAKEISTKEFSAILEKSKEQLVIADFYAEWCMPCLMMAPIIDSLAESNQDVIFVKINVEESQDLASEFNVSGIPCIVFLKEGKEVDRLVGSVSEEMLDEKIKANI